MDFDFDADSGSEPETNLDTEQNTEPDRLKVHFDLDDSNGSGNSESGEDNDSESEEGNDSEVDEPIPEPGKGKQSSNTESIAKWGLGHEVVTQIDADNHEDPEPEQPVLKRRRGRPRKQPQNTQPTVRQQQEQGPLRTAATETDNLEKPVKRGRGRPRKQPQNSEPNSLPRGPGRPRKVPKPTEPDPIDLSDDSEDDLPDDIRAGIKDIGEKVIALCQDLAQETMNYTTSEILKFTRLAMGPISKRVKIQNKRSAWQVALKECKSDAPDEVIRPVKGAGFKGRDGFIGSYQQWLKEHFADSEVRDHYQKRADIVNQEGRVGKVVDLRKQQRTSVKSLMRVVGSYIFV
jgi:hypothetical protein